MAVATISQEMQGVVVRWNPSYGCGDILGADGNTYHLTSSALRRGGIWEWVEDKNGKGKGKKGAYTKGGSVWWRSACTWNDKFATYSE